MNQALRQYLETNAWQLARIKKGITAARKRRVRPADEVFADTVQRGARQGDQTTRERSTVPDDDESPGNPE